MKQVIARAHARGLKFYGDTLPAYKDSVYSTAGGEAKRQAANDLIRTGGAFDAVIDFNAALRNPSDPAYLKAEHDGTDHLHPNDAGYRKITESVDLGLFRPGV